MAVIHPLMRDAGGVTPPAEVLRVRGLVRRLGTVLATDHVDLTVAAGEVMGLLGPNGAGKTTLVRQVVGLLKPDEGSIELVGAPAHPGEVVSYLAQEEPALAELTVATAITTTGRLRGLSRVDARASTAAILEELDLGVVRDRALSQLSGGQRRLAAVGAALTADRPLLVWDEPTTGLDTHARRAVWDAIERRRTSSGTSVLLVTHNVLEAEQLLDRVSILSAGRVIASDTPGRLKARVGAEVRLDVVWRHEPPAGDAVVERLRELAQVRGLRWSARADAGLARALLADLTTGAAWAALDDFTLATPTLEDAYLALGGAQQGTFEAEAA